MLKIVIFDSGYGGELFADLLEEKLGVAAQVIRVIDWRHASELAKNPRKTRKIVETALRPYLGAVDLIFFANHFISLTSLNYFRHHYKTQRFLGFQLPDAAKFASKKTLVLTTQPLTKTLIFRNYLFRLDARKKVVALDEWPALIDDGELTETMISDALKPTLEVFRPDTILLACGQFSDITLQLRKLAKHNAKIRDSFEDSFHDVCKTLRLRGAIEKQK